MPSLTRSLARRKRSAPRGLHLEALERREVLYAPVGNVTAQLVGSTLLLTGDALPNQLLVASVTGGRVAVLTGSGTINGSTNPFITSRPVIGIVANLAGGDDVIGFGNSALGFATQLAALGFPTPPDVGGLQADINAVANGATAFALPGSLSVTTGDGADAIAIIGTVGGSVAANLGSAPTVGPGNGLSMVGPDPAYASRVGGGVSIVGGGQRDFVEVLGTTVAGGFAAALGNGENFLGIGATSVASLAYTGGTARDSVNTSNVRIRNGVSIATGGGRDDVFVGAGGAAAIVGGSVAIDTGADDDFASVSGQVTGAVSIVTGEGADRVGLYDTSVGLSAVVNAGGGSDQVAILGFRVRSNLVVSLGAGDDQLLLGDITSVFAASLDGGPGFNSLTYYEGVPVGSRRFSYTRFQKVTVIV